MNEKNNNCIERYDEYIIETISITDGLVHDEIYKYRFKNNYGVMLAKHLMEENVSYSLYFVYYNNYDNSIESYTTFEYDGKEVEDVNVENVKEVCDIFDIILQKKIYVLLNSEITEAIDLMNKLNQDQIEYVVSNLHSNFKEINKLQTSQIIDEEIKYISNDAKHLKNIDEKTNTSNTNIDKKITELYDKNIGDFNEFEDNVSKNLNTQMYDINEVCDWMSYDELQAAKAVRDAKKEFLKTYDSNKLDKKVVSETDNENSTSKLDVSNTTFSNTNSNNEQQLVAKVADDYSKKSQSSNSVKKPSQKKLKNKYKKRRWKITSTS
ncbi:hypothetical protein [Mycoplasma sp. P36-A1]|uniref:hypothetical protein n=1 Tax=Mycoplasma sp. P36-A1 TaxID=3252900 RepID=UPI003C306A6C